MTLLLPSGKTAEQADQLSGPTVTLLRPFLAPETWSTRFQFKIAADVDRFERFVVAYILLDHLREPVRRPASFRGLGRASLRVIEQNVAQTPPSACAAQASRASYPTPTRRFQSMPFALSHLVN